MLPSPADRAPPLWEWMDTRVLLRLPFSFALAVLTPETRWTPLLRPFVKAKLRTRPPSIRRAEETLVPALEPAGLIDDRDRFLEELLLENERARLHLLAHYRRRPPEVGIRLEGGERVRAALERGRGAVLWVAPTAPAPLVTKMAWHRAGWPVSHLSRYSHGLSRSRLGARLFNPLVHRVENRYLAERVVIGPGEEATAATRVLRRRLAEGRLVSITALPGTGTSVTVPFLGGHLRLSRGPARLARATGALLLPVFCWREGDGRFAVRIDEPLPCTKAPDDAARAFARSFAEVLRHVPAQIGWPTAAHLFVGTDVHR